jgi:hypothetical protein
MDSLFWKCLQPTPLTPENYQNRQQRLTVNHLSYEIVAKKPLIPHALLKGEKGG